MDLKEAHQITQISSEELNSAKTYFGFRHTSINVLSNLTPGSYQSLTKAGWKLSENIEELKQDITDFVNLYSIMYKDSKGRNPGSKLIRGTSNKAITSIGSFIPQFLSTSTDINVSKTFCEYEDAALVHFSVEPGVPFLDTAPYRDENRANEKEVILSPFCEVIRKERGGTFDGYTHYNIAVRKATLEEKSSEELDNLLAEVVGGFSQNIADINEYNHLYDSLEVLNSQFSRFQGDLEDRQYMLERKKELSEKLNSLGKSTYTFRVKLQDLLKGLCRQKEIGIDKADELIQENRMQEEKEAKTKRAEEKARIEALQKEENRKKIVSELSSKLAAGPSNVTDLETTVIKTYQDLLSTETRAKQLARTLGVGYNRLISNTGISQEITQFQENMKIALSKIEGTTIDSDTSLENATQSSTQITPLLDGVSYGLVIAESFPEIMDMHRTQSGSEIKRNLYFKVQSALQSAKIQRYLQEKDNINGEVIGFFGRLTGKDLLKNERLRNVNLKIKLEQNAIPQEQQKYSVRDMLADIYACSLTELGGTLTPEMSELYSVITSVFEDAKTGKFSDEYVKQLASQKIAANQHHNLPVVSSRRFRLFGGIKSQTEVLKSENNELQEKLSHPISNRNNWVQPVQKSDAIALFEQRLKGIIVNTRERDKSKSKTDLDQTFDLWG